MIKWKHDEQHEVMSGKTFDGTIPALLSCTHPFIRREMASRSFRDVVVVLVLSSPGNLDQSHACAPR